MGPLLELKLQPVAIQVFKTGVDEWLRLCKCFHVLVRQHLHGEDVSFEDLDDDDDTPHSQSPAQAQKKAKRKAAVLGPDDVRASSKGAPPVVSIEWMRLGDDAERGVKGMPLHRLCLVWHRKLASCILDVLSWSTGETVCRCGPGNCLWIQMHCLVLGRHVMAVSCMLVTTHPDCVLCTILACLYLSQHL